jgi:hypothetical protein
MIDLSTIPPTGFWGKPRPLSGIVNVRNSPRNLESKHEWTQERSLPGQNHSVLYPTSSGVCPQDTNNKERRSDEFKI